MNIVWRFAWRNIWRNPRRTVLTILAIAFGAALLVFSVGLQLGQYDLMISNSVRIYHGLLQVQRQGYLDEPRIRSSIKDIEELAAQLRQRSGIDSIAARANGFALVSSENRTYGSIVSGVEPVHEAMVSSIPGLIKQGRYLSGTDSNEVIIGSSLANNMHLKVGDDLVILGSGRDGSVAATILPVVGVFESGSRELDRNLIQMPLDTFQDTFSMGNQGHAIVIYHEDIDQVQFLQQQFQDLVVHDEQLRVLRWDELQPGLKQIIELDYASGWLMYIVLVAIIVFSIMNTFLMSVLERTREFGIMLALGYRAMSIGRLVMLEAFIMTIIALLLGILIGVCVNTYFYIYGLSLEGMEELAAMYNMPSSITPQMSVKAILLGPAVILVFTLLSALYPAMRIRLLEPVEAMRKV